MQKNNQLRKPPNIWDILHDSVINGINLGFSARFWDKRQGFHEVIPDTYKAGNCVKWDLPLFDIPK